LVISDTGFSADFPHIEKVVGNSLTLSFRKFRRPKVHSTIELHRISVDDFRHHTLLGQTLGNSDGKVTLSGPGSANKGDNGRKLRRLRLSVRRH